MFPSFALAPVIPVRPALSFVRVAALSSSAERILQVWVVVAVANETAGREEAEAIREGALASAFPLELEARAAAALTEIDIDRRRLVERHGARTGLHAVQIF